MQPRVINIVSHIKTGTDYITVAEAKTHLRVTGTDDDTYIEALIGAAFNIASDYVGYPLLKSNVQFVFDGGDSDDDNILRVMARILSISAVQYYDEDGVLHTADYAPINNVFGNYGVNIYLNELESDSVTDKYVVTAVCGFEVVGASVDQSMIFPKNIKQAILMLIANMYDNRQDLTIGTIAQEMPINSKWMLNTYKMFVFA